jgi:predicted PurR-regulated permease PerM
MVEGRADSVLRRALPLYVALVLAFLTAVGVILLAQLEHVLLILFISLLFAAALSGPTERLEEVRIPRAVAVPLIYLTAMTIAVGVIWLVTPPLFDEVADFGEAAPEYVERYESVRDAYEELRERYPSLGPFDERVAGLGEAIAERAGERAFELPTALFELFLDLLSIFVISTLIVSTRERILAALLDVVHPHHRAKTRDVLVKMWTTIGFYLRAKVIVMAIVGALTYGALVVIGVPFALPLAIIVALGEAIPRAGPWLARIPLLAIAALEGLATLGITLAASVLIENLKGYVISPVVEGDQLDIHPLLVFISVLVGSALLGVAGAFVAVPAAAMLKVLYDEVVRPWRQKQLGTAGAAQQHPRVQ